MLNDDKTEFLLLGTKDINSITVGEFIVNTKPVVMNLGSWFDSQLTLVCLLISAGTVAQLSFIYITSVVLILQVPKPHGN